MEFSCFVSLEEVPVDSLAKALLAEDAEVDATKNKNVEALVGQG